MRCMPNSELQSLSPIEQIYDRNVCAEKLKHGTKYEQLTALVFQVLDANAMVNHNVKLRGDGKLTVHQIDVEITRGGDTRHVVIECRDKSGQNKIDLDQARSFATVVNQLGAHGIMVTTNGFTAGAMTLAADEGIELMVLRPFLPNDIDGRLMTMDVKIRGVIPVAETLQIRVIQTTESQIRVEWEQKIPLDSPIISGSPFHVFEDLVGSLMSSPLESPIFNEQQTTSKNFTPPIVVLLEGREIHISGMRLEFHLDSIETSLTIDAGERIAELILKSLNSETDRVIWKDELQNFLFVDPGRVVKRPPYL